MGVSEQFSRCLLGTRPVPGEKKMVGAERRRGVAGERRRAGLDAVFPAPSGASARPAAAFRTQVSRWTGERDRETPDHWLDPDSQAEF